MFGFFKNKNIHLCIIATINCQFDNQYQLNEKICTLLIAALALLSLPAKAQNVEAYGILAASDDYPLLITHVVKFGLDAASGAEMSNVFTYSDYTTAAAWAEDTYYVADPTGAQSVRLSWTVDGLEIAEPVPGQVVIVVIANDNGTVTRRRVLMK